MAADQRDLGEQGALGARALRPLERRQRVLVGHGDPVVGPAAIAQVGRGIDPLEAEALALGPRAGDRRLERDRAIAGPGERAGQGEPLALDQRLVAGLIGEPQAAFQRAVRQPGLAAHGRRGEPARRGDEAALGEALLECLERRPERRWHSAAAPARCVHRNSTNISSTSAPPRRASRCSAGTVRNGSCAIAASNAAMPASALSAARHWSSSMRLAWFEHRPALPERLRAAPAERRTGR